MELEKLVAESGKLQQQAKTRETEVAELKDEFSRLKTKVAKVNPKEKIKEVEKETEENNA